MSNKFNIVLATLLLASVQLSAILIKADAPACVSQSSYSEFLNALRNNDKAGVGRLIMNQECFIVTAGTSYGVVNKGSSLSLIRVYWDQNGYKLWTATRAIQ